MKRAIVLVSAVSVLSQEASAFAFTSNVARPSALYRNKHQLRMTTTKEREVKDIKVGVIGCGRIGLVHLEAITKAPGVTPIIVSNPTVSKAEKGKSAWSWPLDMDRTGTLHTACVCVVFNARNIRH
jgi:phosphoglycerate dehydrogenase-like enzyme